MAHGAAQQQVIERAARAARKALLAWREHQAAVAHRLLRQLAADIGAEMLAHADSTGRVTVSALPSVRAYLSGRLDTFWRRWRQLLDDTLLQAAGIGADLVELSGTGVGSVAVAEGVLRFLREFRAVDGLTLSDRLWRIERGAQEAMTAAIEGAIARGESSYQAAARYVAEGVEVPASLQHGLDAASAGSLRRSLASLLLDDTGDIFYSAQRVLRTETNRAYTEAYVASVAQHPDVVGVRFNLSPLHPKTDICDLYARANLHGLGAGVYPPGDHPYPAHPNTLSFLTTVFREQVTDADARAKQTPFEWLAGQSGDVREGVLGGQRKAAAFAAGLLHEGDLRTPWRDIAGRLGLDA